jgi:CARDB
MEGGLQRLCALGAGVLALVAVSAPAAVAAPKRANLTVSSGSVGVTRGRVKGSFKVFNLGGAKAAASKAAVSIRVSRHSRLLKTYSINKLRAGHGQTVKVSSPLPSGLPKGSWSIVACADSAHKVKEGAEGDNCLAIGLVKIGSSSASTVPADPIQYSTDTAEDVSDPQGDYWVDVPPSYNADNRTPETLLVWMHGCGGEAEGDAYDVSPGNDRSYIAISIGGRDDDCWDPNSDVPKVLAAIADVETHFNIDRRRVIIAGYSSGGDLAYRTIFYNANMFAGILAENTSPFRDTGSTQDQSIAAAAWKFNVVHLAHTSDETYPLAGVTQEVNALKGAGFPVTFITRPGTHYDPDDDVAGTGTDYDLHHYLLPHINDGWLAPPQ